MRRLEGKAAIITGAGTGIGEETAYCFVQEGAKVAVCDIDSVGGKDTVEKIKAMGGEAVFYEMDVREEAQVAETFKKVEEDFGRIDILINNAGVTGPEPVPDQISMEDFDYVMNTDCRGSFICAKTVIEYMRRQRGGNIVNLSSICGLKAEVAGLAPYHIAKGAVQMMTKVFAMSYAKENIRCNCVNPGTTLTPLIIQYGTENYGSVDAYADFVGPMHPMSNPKGQKLGEAKDVAMAIVYLASDEAKWVTGATISVDGGWSVC